MKWLILTGSFMSYMASAGAAVADPPVAPYGIVFIEEYRNRQVISFR